MFKIINYNLFVFIFIIFVIETFCGEWFGLNIINETCKNTITHHNYCSEIIYKRKLHSIDGGKEITNFINIQGIRVRSKEEMKKRISLSDYSIINIGDSFLQSDEIPFEKTFTYWMNQYMGEEKAIQIGYASWSPIIFLNFIKNNKFKKGTNFNIFIMTNDFLNDYYASNYAYHKILNKKNNLFYMHEKTKKKDEKLKSIIQKKSFFYNKVYVPFINLTSERETKKFDKKKEFSEFEENFKALNDDCILLKSKKKYVTPILYEYLSFSFKDKCWSKEINNSVINAISDLNKIINYVNKEIQGKIKIFYIPPGWSFQNENVSGKEKAPYYIAENAVIGSEGLKDYIRRNLKHQNSIFIDLTTVLESIKKNQNKQIYFSLDGHWNEFTHEKLGEWISKIK